MDQMEHAFAALSRRISSLPAPERYAPAPEAIASLIERINDARRAYEPRALSLPQQIGQ